jgi:hypothetical protein
MITGHLFKADFRSLRILIFITWGALLLSALPALLASTNNFSSFPLGHWQFNPEHFEKETRALIDREKFIPQMAFTWNALASLCAWILALSIGFVNTGWNESRPMKRRHHVAAKAALLAVALILPQIALIAISLLKHGLPVDYVWKGVVACAGVFVPLHIAICLFGAICGRLVWSVFGIVVLIITISTVGLFERHVVTKLLSPISDLWGNVAGPRYWIYLSACALGLAFLGLIRARQWKLSRRLIASALVVLACGLATKSLKEFRITDSLTERQINVTITKAEGYIAQMPSGKELRLDGEFEIDHVGDNVFVFWQPLGTSQILSANGNTLAYSEPNEKGLPSIFPQNNQRAHVSTLSSYLPDATILNEPHYGITFGPTKTDGNLGLFQFPAGTEVHDVPIEVEAKVAGLLYRQVVAFEGTLDEKVNIKRLGYNLTLQQHSSTPIVDALLIRPSIGMSSHFTDLNWRFNNHQWLFYYYLQDRQLLIPAHSSLSGRSPLLGGAAVERLIFEPSATHLPRKAYPHDNEDREKLDYSNARILALTTEFVGYTIQSVKSDVTMKNQEVLANHDYYHMTQQNRVEPRHFFELYREQRPDPTTATPEELGKWLRLVSGQFMDEWMTRDLAQFAQRYPDVLSRLGNSSSAFQRPWGDALAKGAPESRRDVIFEAMHLENWEPSHNWLPSVITQRGWVNAARDDLMKAWRDGHERIGDFLAAIISLEEPETFPALLELVRTRNVDTKNYLRIRQLPGIEPALSEAVDAYFDSVPKNGTIKDLTIPVIHGHRLAMELYVGNIAADYTLYRTRDLPDLFSPLPNDLKSWVMNFDPDQWAWDPLAKLWTPKEKHS